MAESFVQITEGSGKKLHSFERTIGANTVQDEITILGEQSLASYTVTDGDYSTATVNSHILQIMAGASNKVRIRRIEIFQSVMATTVTNMYVFLYRLTTAGSGGTSITPRPLDTSDGAATATAQALPSSKGTEGVLIWSGFAYMMQTLAASSQLNQPILAIDFDRPRSKPLIIPAGTSNGIAIKNGTAVAGATVRFVVWFDESPY